MPDRVRHDRWGYFSKVTFMARQPITDYSSLITDHSQLTTHYRPLLSYTVISIRFPSGSRTTLSRSAFSFEPTEKAKCAIPRCWDTSCPTLIGSEIETNKFVSASLASVVFGHFVSDILGPGNARTSVSATLTLRTFGL